MKCHGKCKGLGLVYVRGLQSVGYGSFAALQVCDMHKKPFPGNIHGSLNISKGLLSLTMNF